MTIRSSKKARRATGLEGGSAAADGDAAGRGAADGGAAAGGAAAGGAAAGGAAAGRAADAADARASEAPGTTGGGTLYLVATPIGNLADITLRALDVLRSVEIIAAEDTRTSRILLDRHHIPTRDDGHSRLVSYHARNAARRGPELLHRLRAGARVALVTDAGTPGVSDPGAELVSQWAAEDGRVAPIPGPSAVLAAVMSTGVAGPRWSFEGFLPRRGGERRERLRHIAADERATVLFEAANRLTTTLGDLAAACGVARRGAVCRELTKMHEEIVRGSLGELARMASEGRITLRGEIVIVVGDADVVRAGDAEVAPGGSAVNIVRGGASTEDSDRLTAARAEVARLAAGGMSRGEAARRVAAESGIRRRALYELPSPSEPRIPLRHPARRVDT